MQFESIAARARAARRRGPLLAGALLALAAPTALAADPQPYGQLARWGGAAAVGDARLGLIGGLAADPVDDTVYAVDRRSADTTTGLATFRVRKFAGATGELLASGTFTATGPVATAPPHVGAVAVDHAAGHLYVSIVASNASGQAPTFQQVQVIGTTATGGVLSAPADVADGTLLDNAPRLRTTNLLAVDPATGNVLVAGLHPTLLAPVVHRFRGTAAGGRAPGEEAGTWTGATLTRAPTISALAVDGSSRVYLATKASTAAFFGTSVRRIDAALTEETPLLPTAVQTSTNYVASSSAFFNTSGGYGTRTLGTQLAVTASGELLASYASGVSSLFGASTVSEPFSSTAGARSFGVRRLASNGEDLGIVAGGGTFGGACWIGVADAPSSATPQGAYGLAVGSGGKVFVPSWLPDNTVEIAVFGPGGSDCPVPSPALRAIGPDGEIPSGGNAPIGAEVTLDASASDLRTWPVLEIDWDLDGNATNGSEGDGFEVKNRRPTVDVDPLSPAPAMTTRRTWNAAGTYTVRARILTVAGTAEISREITVAAAPVPPIAALTGPALGTAGSAVTFDASGSRAQPDGSTAALTYAWDFGDANGTFTAGAARQAHTYAAAGTYSVRVRVTDSSNGRQTVSATRTIVVREAPRRDPPREDPPTTDPPQQEPPRIDPPPADTTPPAGLTVSATTAIGRNGALALQLGCPAGESSCAGTVELKTARAVASTTARRGRRGRRAKARVLTLGRTSFTAAGGSAASVSLKLSSAGRKLLARGKRLKVVLTIAVRDAAGNASTVRRTLTLTVARARGRSRSRRR